MSEVLNAFYILLWSLSLTIVIELVVGLLLGIREKSDIGFLIIINYITNPIFNYVMSVINYYTSNNTIMIISVLIGEVIVIFCEYTFLKNKLKYEKLNPLLLSILLNSASAILGYIINTFL